MSTLRAALLALAALATGLCAAAGPASDPPVSQWLQSLPTVQVSVETADGTQTFLAWVASTPVQKSRGLMFVRALDPGRAMLFRFDPPEYASFWMRNTYISLDLLFIGPDGRIVSVVERAEPLSTRPLESTAPVSAVLEVLGGTAERLGIEPGDQVEAPLGIPAR